MPRHAYIAGASSRARTTREYLEYLEPDTKVPAFLVSCDMTDDPEMVDGIPVLKIMPGEKFDVSADVYLGMRGVNHEKVRKELIGAGFHADRIIPVSVDLDAKLRNEYVRKKYDESGKKFLKFDDLCFKAPEKSFTNVNACIYQAGSIYDGKLSDQYKPLNEEKMIQVGAALSDRRLFDGVITDDTGDNISSRNRQFCELTGLYWIWKNAKEDVVGLVHYRRHFLMPANWVDVFSENDVDVILPVPLYVGPSIEGNYRDRHISEDWDVMMDIIGKLYPDDLEKVKVFFGSGLYSPCNMFISKRSVLAEMCEWMFPILLEVAERIGTHEDKYQNRYPGFMSERLMTYFFESQRDKYRVVYADKNFLS